MAGMAVRRKELQNAESRKSNVGNGLIEGMADRMVEWQTEMATYVLFTVHTDEDDDNDDDDDNTLIFYIIDDRNRYLEGMVTDRKLHVDTLIFIPT